MQCQEDNNLCRIKCFKIIIIIIEGLQMSWPWIGNVLRVAAILTAPGKVEEATPAEAV